MRVNFSKITLSKPLPANFFRSETISKKFGIFGFFFLLSWLARPIILKEEKNGKAQNLTIQNLKNSFFSLAHFLAKQLLFSLSCRLYIGYCGNIFFNRLIDPPSMFTIFAIPASNIAVSKLDSYFNDKSLDVSPLLESSTPKIKNAAFTLKQETFFEKIGRLILRPVIGFVVSTIFAWFATTTIRCLEKIFLDKFIFPTNRTTAKNICNFVKFCALALVGKYLIKKYNENSGDPNFLISTAANALFCVSTANIISPFFLNKLQNSEAKHF